MKQMNRYLSEDFGLEPDYAGTAGGDPGMSLGDALGKTGDSSVPARLKKAAEKTEGWLTTNVFTPIQDALSYIGSSFSAVWSLLMDWYERGKALVMSLFGKGPSTDPSDPLYQTGIPRAVVQSPSAGQVAVVVLLLAGAVIGLYYLCKYIYKKVKNWKNKKKSLSEGKTLLMKSYTNLVKLSESGASGSSKGNALVNKARECADKVVKYAPSEIAEPVEECVTKFNQSADKLYAKSLSEGLFKPTPQQIFLQQYAQQSAKAKDPTASLNERIQAQKFVRLNKDRYVTLKAQNKNPSLLSLGNMAGLW